MFKILTIANYKPLARTPGFGSLEMKTLHREHGHEGMTACPAIRILELQCVNASLGVWVQMQAYMTIFWETLSQTQILHNVNSLALCTDLRTLTPGPTQLCH